MSLQTSIQSILNVTDPMRSFWSAKLSNEKEISEKSLVFDFRKGGLRPLDWSLDLVSTSDIQKIKELRLHCPDGQIATLLIEEPGTCFQIKIANLSILTGGSAVQAHLIGRVENKENGLCSCAIWDREMGLLWHHTSIYDFESWRPGVLPLKALSLDVLGLRM